MKKPVTKKKKYRLKKDLLRINRNPKYDSRKPNAIRTAPKKIVKRGQTPVKGLQSAKKTSFTTLILLAVIAAIIFVISLIIFDILIAVLIIIFFALVMLCTQVLDNNPRKSKKRKIVKGLFMLTMIGGILAIIAFTVFMVYVIKEAPAFDISKLERKETTLIYDNQNRLIATLGTEKREKIAYNQLPEVLIDSVVATEDSRFFQHNGFDAPRFVKATLGQLAGAEDAGGGSTLTMQVSKNNFTSKNAEGWTGIVRKFSDVYLAIFKIEKAYTKQEIIEFYVNEPFMGNNAYGVEQACQTYFGKSASEIGLAEAALIAGLFQAPGAYDPFNNIEGATDRRNEVLNLLVRHGYITNEEKEIAGAIPVEDLLGGQTSKVVNEFQGYIDTVVKEIDTKTGMDPYIVPMIIYTNMDRSKQSAMNDVFTSKSYKWYNTTVQGSAAALDVNSGKIIAIGAGRNRTGERTFNYATDINRQIGSTSKPMFDYGPAMEYLGWGTGQLLVDRPYTYSSGQTMANFDGGYKGNMTLREALRQSRNVTALKTFQKVPNDKIKEFVLNLGIKPEINENGGLHEAHSIGAFNGSNPLTMAAAYAAFANGGYYYEPYSVNKLIIRESGESLTFKSSRKKVMSDSTAYMITSILQMVASDTGVSQRVSTSVAIKTGTTDYDREMRQQMGYPSSATNDGWIAGYSPTIAMAMWTGYDKNVPNVYLTQSQMVTQRNGMYRALATAVYNKTRETFKRPSSVISTTIEKFSDPVALPSAGTPANMKITELFRRGTEPKEASKTYLKLENVANLNASLANDVVSLNWNAVAQPDGFEDQGTFGYKIYKDSAYLGFTTNNYYSHTTTSPYATYKVVTGFSSGTANDSSGSTYTLQGSITFKFNESSGPINLTSSDTYIESSTPILVFEDLLNVTTGISNYSSRLTKTITRNGAVVANVDVAIAGTYIIKYSYTYKGVTSNEYTKTVIVS